MKTRILTLAAFGLAFAGLTVPAFGQLGQTVTASIPFTFVVQGKQLPAGNYSFQRDESNPAVLAIRSRDGTAEKLVLTESAQMMKTPNQSELIFDKVDGDYFLSQIWTVGNDLGLQVPEAKAEQRWEQAYIASHSHAKQPTEQITMPCTP